eukprot:SAG31_NODE_4822_length_2929_cov_2.447350_3_plen_238_part_00
MEGWPPDGASDAHLSVTAALLGDRGVGKHCLLSCIGASESQCAPMQQTAGVYACHRVSVELHSGPDRLDCRNRFNKFNRSENNMDCRLELFRGDACDGDAGPWPAADVFVLAYDLSTEAASLRSLASLIQTYSPQLEWEHPVSCWVLLGLKADCVAKIEAAEQNSREDVGADGWLALMRRLRALQGGRRLPEHRVSKASTRDTGESIPFTISAAFLDRLQVRFRAISQRPSLNMPVG